MKYILFYPKDIDDEEPKDTVLWKCTFRIHKDMKLPEEIQEMVDEKDHPPLPLSKWEGAFYNLHLLYDFTYAKEYVYLVDNVPVFTVSLLALDINRENNQIVVKEKLAEKILNQMSLKLKGSMHPEKFYKKLINEVDLSEDTLLREEDVTDIMLNLECLCEQCLHYESPIEWKPVS